MTKIIVTKKNNRIHIKTAQVDDVFITDKCLYIIYSNNHTEYIKLEDIITISSYTYTYHTRHKLLGSNSSTLKIMAPLIYI